MPLAADVARVEPASLARDAGELDHLLGVGVGARRIDQAGGQPEAAVAHGRADEILHRGELGGACGGRCA